MGVITILMIQFINEMDQEKSEKVDFEQIIMVTYRNR